MSSVSVSIQKQVSGSVSISGSKSETNRLLILQALFPQIEIKNISDSEDSDAMRKGLSVADGTVDVGHAGTAMRFLTAYFAAKPGTNVLLTGSPRMKERPIKVLVDALRKLGADISYESIEGYPPIAIKGKSLTKGEVSIMANVSSQYLTALLLTAPALPSGLKLTIEGELTSRPYLEMTIALMKQVGLDVRYKGNLVTVPPQQKLKPVSVTVEPDWSSASYFFSIVALSERGTKLHLSDFGKNSLQGDREVVSIYKNFGVKTTFGAKGITLIKENKEVPKFWEANLQDTPDIAQTIAVTCFGLGTGCRLTGLHTLKIKETDRLHALKIELEKLGATVSITDDALLMAPGGGFKTNVTIDTHRDHRMAMSFAPLALRVPLRIGNPEVVGKSYTAFWNDLKAIGFSLDFAD